ncbi:MAG: DUF2961 domain-containing protein [Actinomycetia bacterium]|nr:DUF2961 domain-containing protein [Actinomycetes bacterium]MCP5031058.1 DUF2961 domain-containing protein [Actinomycetes bacterium]
MELGQGSLAGLARLRNFERRRLSSYDRTGGNHDFVAIDPGETHTFGEIEGPGCVKHIWVTLMALPDEEHIRRDVVLRVYWDGEDTPSVEAPIGDFFGVGFGLRRNFTSLPLQMSPEDGKSMNCWFPMPFAEGARFEVVNESAARLIFFFYVDYEEYERLEDGLGRFHAHYRHVPTSAGIAATQGWTRDDYGYSDSKPSGSGRALEGPWRHPNLSGDDNYVILDVQGNGQYVGCVLNIDVVDRQVNDWYGEGDDMIFIDGEAWPPRLHGTGTEDYFNTAFCPTQEVSQLYHGITVYSGTPEWPWSGKNSMYRFHVEDPIRFRSSIRVSIETGHANALANDYSSVAYWYQTDRADALPSIPPIDQRRPR